MVICTTFRISLTSYIMGLCIVYACIYMHLHLEQMVLVYAKCEWVISVSVNFSNYPCVHLN